MLLAARGVKQSNASMRLAVAGADHAGGYSATTSGDDLAAMPLDIVNRGQEQVLATVNVLATPLTALPAGGKGFTIERKYHTLDGVETDISQVKQNDRFVVVLAIVQQNNWQARIVVSDLLPGGFEIDSPKLVGSADLKSFEWLGNASAPTGLSPRSMCAQVATGNSAQPMWCALFLRAGSPSLLPWLKTCTGPSLPPERPKGGST